MSYISKQRGLSCDCPRFFIFDSLPEYPLSNFRGYWGRLSNFLFAFIRPQRRNRQNAEKLRNNLQIGRFFYHARAPPGFDAPRNAIEITRRSKYVRPKKRLCLKQAGTGRHRVQERHQGTYPPDPRRLLQRGGVSEVESLVRRGLPHHRAGRAWVFQPQPAPGGLGRPQRPLPGGPAAGSGRGDGA